MVKIIPKVSVLMPVYNAEKTVVSAIFSVLNQSFEDLELCVCNDGSYDKTPSILNEIKDPRLKLITHAKNMGIVNSRNALLKIATGKYIAWLDADDIFLPEKLIKQVQYMEEHPEIGVCGTWAKVRNHSLKYVKMPTFLDFPKYMLPFKNIFIHSTLMLRKEILEGKYFDPFFEYMEDQALYASIINHTQSIVLPYFGSSYLMQQELLHQKEVLYQIKEKKMAWYSQYWKNYITKELLQKYASYLANGKMHKNLYLMMPQVQYPFKRYFQHYLFWICFRKYGFGWLSYLAVCLRHLTLRPFPRYHS